MEIFTQKLLQQMKDKIKSFKNGNQNFKYFGLVEKNKIYKNKKDIILFQYLHHL